MAVKERLLLLFSQMDAQSGWVIIKGEAVWVVVVVGAQDEVKRDE